MKNHFGDGILAGLQASTPQSMSDIRHYCDDYRRGYVCGYAHQRASLRGRQQRSRAIVPPLRADARYRGGVLYRRQQPIAGGMVLRRL